MSHIVIFNNVALVTSKGPDQTAHKCSLIRVIACHISHSWNLCNPQSEAYDYTINLMRII